jgi:hypothetical protein
MSRVTLTNLVPGETASSTDYNAILESWEDGTVAGSIDQYNVMEEGIDRRNISDRSIDVYRGAAYYTSSSASSAMGAGPTTVGMMAGLDPVTIGPFAVSTGDDCVIRCSAFFKTSTTLATGTLFYLERNPDSGVWTTISATKRSFQTNVYTVSATGCNQVYQVTHLHAGGAGTWYYRLRCVNPTGTVQVQNVEFYSHTDAV